MSGEPNPVRARVGTVLTRVGWPIAACVAVLAVTTPLAATGDVVAGETAVFRAGNDIPRAVGEVLEVVMALGTAVGLVGVLAAAAVTRRWRPAAAAVAVWFLIRPASRAIKEAVDRGRPDVLLDEVVLRQHALSNPGFTSSHSAIAAGLAVVVAWAWPQARWPVLATAAAVGVARIYVGVHLPLDLLGGWALGALVALVVTAVLDVVAPEPSPDPTRSEAPTRRT